MQVEVGDDPSKPRVIAPNNNKKGSVKAIKEEIIIEKCDDDDDDIPDGEALKVGKHSALWYW